LSSERRAYVGVPLDEEEAKEYAALMAFEDEEEDGEEEGGTSVLAPANLIQSYTALLNLGLLGDDFSKLDRLGLLRFVARCQNSDGSFVPFPAHPLRGLTARRGQVRTVPR
jgi:prenyltransferase beta subunit